MAFIICTNRSVVVVGRSHNTIIANDRALVPLRDRWKSRRDSELSRISHDDVCNAPPDSSPPPRTYFFSSPLFPPPKYAGYRCARINDTTLSQPVQIVRSIIRVCIMYTRFYCGYKLYLFVRVQVMRVLQRVIYKSRRSLFAHDSGAAFSFD